MSLTAMEQHTIYPRSLCVSAVRRGDTGNPAFTSCPMNILKSSSIITLLLFSLALLANAQTKVTTKDGKEVTILDADGDGWDDLWRALYPMIEHHDKTTDTDGDGKTDYEEMLAWTAPIVMEPPTPAQVAEANRQSLAAATKRKDDMALQRAVLAPFMVKPSTNSKGEYATSETVDAEKKDKLVKLAQQEAQKAAAARVRVDDFVRRKGVDTSFITREGAVSALADVVNEQPQFYVTHNAVAADTISTDEVQAGGNLGLTLNGNGTTVGHWDGGDILVGHQEFTVGTSRVIDMDGVSPLGIQGHPTHVAGTIGARGAFAAARGMSGAATIHAYDFQNDLAEMPAAVAANALHLSNHSYGFQHGWGTISVGGTLYYAWYGNTSISQTEDFAFGFYSNTARTVDTITYHAPGYLPVWSAANERGAQGDAPPTQPIGHYAFNGTNFVVVTNQTRPADYTNHTGFDLISEHGVAKNILTIAAVEDIVGGYVSAPGVAVAAFSSFGPVDDGRVKPDLSANGVNLTSSWSTATNVYAIQSGTSMAAPNVTGSLNLLVEHYANLFGNAAQLRAATLKALAIHTADEAGPNAGPDYRFGWGLMNTRTATQLLTQQAQSNLALTNLKQVTLNNTDYVEFPVNATGGATPLRVTLCWTDPPGTVPADGLNVNVAALVNDLDLRITSGANTFFPWRLNPASPTAAATNLGDNNRDTVEQVVVANPVGGQQYLVRVTHKGTLRDDTGSTAPQALSIIVSGVQTEPQPWLRVLQLTNTAPNEFTILWASVVGSTYRIETSTDLFTWSDLPGDVSATKIMTAVPLAITPGDQRRFWRVRRL